MIQTMIPTVGVLNVAKYLAWYQYIFDLPPVAPTDKHHGLLTDHHGNPLIRVVWWDLHDHHVDTHEYPASLRYFPYGYMGSGLALYFVIDDVESVIQRVKTSRAKFPDLLEVPACMDLIDRRSTKPPMAEFRDPAGYSVVLLAEHTPHNPPFFDEIAGS